MSTKLAVPVTPEIALALEAGLKDGLRSLMGDENPRSKVASDQKLKGVKIDLTLEIGELSIGHDTDKSPTCSIPLLPTLALMVRRMGIQRDAALALLKDVMTTALSTDKSATAALLAETGVDEAMELIQAEVIATLPRVPVAKTVKAKGSTITVTGVTQAA